jgi:hypothetical protein
MNTYDFGNRVAIVTGGGQGIGLTVAERMLGHGGSVAIWDRDQKLVDALHEKYGRDGKVLALNADIGDMASVDAAVKATLERFGKIDISSSTTPRSSAPTPRPGSTRRRPSWTSSMSGSSARSSSARASCRI